MANRIIPAQEFFAELADLIDAEALAARDDVIRNVGTEAEGIAAYNRFWRECFQGAQEMNMGPMVM